MMIFDRLRLTVYNDRVARNRDLTQYRQAADLEFRKWVARNVSNTSIYSIDLARN